MHRLFLILSLLIFLIPSAAQESATTTDTAESAQEASAETDSTAEAHPELAFLDFHTYELTWARYKNEAADGARLIGNGEQTIFQYARFNNGNKSLRLADLQDAETLADLLENHDFTYDADAINGDCDAEKLAAFSSDIFCAPGTEGMPHGNIFLALYDADGGLIALSASIDNKAGGAERETWQPAAKAEASETDGCGPYNPGQWVDAAEHRAAGLELPIQDDHPGATAYQCVVEAGAAYLKAYAGQVAQANGASANETGDSGSAVNGGSGDSENRSSRGEPQRGIPDGDDDDCDAPEGCDIGDIGG